MCEVWTNLNFISMKEISFPLTENGFYSLKSARRTEIYKKNLKNAIFISIS